MLKIRRKKIREALLSEKNFQKNIASLDKFIAATHYKNEHYKKQCFDFLFTNESIFFHLVPNYYQFGRFCVSFPEYCVFAFDNLLRNRDHFIKVLNSSFGFTSVLEKFSIYTPKFFEILFFCSIENHFEVFNKLIQSAYAFTSLVQSFPDYKHQLVNCLLTNSALFNLIIKNYDNLQFILESATEYTDRIFQKLFLTPSLFKQIFIQEHYGSVLIYKQINITPKYSKLLWEHYFQYAFEPRLINTINSKEHSKLLLNCLTDDINHTIKTHNFSTNAADICCHAISHSLKLFENDEKLEIQKFLVDLNGKLKKYGKYNLTNLCLVSLQKTGILQTLIDEKKLPVELCDKARNVMSFQY